MIKYYVSRGIAPISKDYDYKWQAILNKMAIQLKAIFVFRVFGWRCEVRKYDNEKDL